MWKQFKVNKIRVSYPRASPPESRAETAIGIWTLPRAAAAARARAARANRIGSSVFAAGALRRRGKKKLQLLPLRR